MCAFQSESSDGKKNKHVSIFILCPQIHPPISHACVRHSFRYVCVCELFDSVSKHPTDPFTILEFQNPPPVVPELHKIRQSPDLEALKLWKGRSGMLLSLKNFPDPANLFDKNRF